MNKEKDDKKKYTNKRWIACPIEEEYFGQDRKMGKQSRKEATAKDRSKYKKTDREKFQKSEELHKNIKLSKDQFLSGTVLSIKPEGIMVECDGKMFTCILRGLLKKEKRQEKNLVTVGDIVLFETNNPGEGVIAHIEPRKTILSRADNLSRRKEQLIASNIDQVIITGSVVSPALKPSLLDRYIIAAQKGGMEPLIVINKIDLLVGGSKDEEFLAQENELYQETVRAYAETDHKVISVSLMTGQGIDELKAAMRGKSSVFSGQSGVGKSSLINVITGSRQKVGEMVDKTKKGSHTTSTTQLIPLEFGGWCVDTPGIKSFGVWDLKKEEVEQYFSEIHACGSECRFPDCSHRNETGCAVREAVEQGKLSLIRYLSYISLIESVSQEHLRR